MTDLTSRLSTLKSDNEKAKADLQRKNGELDAVMARIKKEFGFTDLALATEHLKKMSGESTGYRILLEAMITEAENKLHPKHITAPINPLVEPDGQGGGVGQW